MAKRILNLFYNGGAGPVLLWKDVGGVPYTLSRWYGWEAALAYADVKGVMNDERFEHFVRLLPFHPHGRIFPAALRFVWEHIREYDVLMLFHMPKFAIPLILLARFRNPKIKVYVKLDMGPAYFEERFVKEGGFLYRRIAEFAEILGAAADLYTVEAESYVAPLNTLRLYRGRVKYLPNGFFAQERAEETVPKEKLLLTMGRLGTPQKNTELLLDAFAALPEKTTKGWKLVLGGAIYGRNPQEGGRNLHGERFVA